MRLGTSFRFVSMAVLLYVFWLLLSGAYDKIHLMIIGVVVALLAAGLGLILGYTDREGHPIELSVGALTYWPWLVVEILKSSVQVSRIILDPKLPISPQLIRVPTSMPGAVGLVTYANSITLTPGTITVRVERPEHDFVVHALTKDTAEGLRTGEMDRRVAAMAGRT